MLTDTQAMMQTGNATASPEDSIAAVHSSSVLAVHTWWRLPAQVCRHKRVQISAVHTRLMLMKQHNEATFQPMQGIKIGRESLFHRRQSSMQVQTYIQTQC